jgi:hypothetical protein
MHQMDAIDLLLKVFPEVIKVQKREVMSPLCLVLSNTASVDVIMLDAQEEKSLKIIMRYVARLNSL